MATLPNACAFTVSNTPGNSSGFVVDAVLSGPYRIPRASEDGATAFLFVREGSVWEICESAYTHSSTTWSRGALTDSSGASVARQTFTSACIVHVVGFVAEDVADVRTLLATAAFPTSDEGTSRSITADDDGYMLRCTAEITLTWPAGLAPNPTVIVLPPDGGAVTIACSGGATLNGGTGALDRYRAVNQAGVAVVAAGSDAYGVSGT